MESPEQLIQNERLDAILVHGYTHRFEWQLLRAAHRLGRRTAMRGEFTDAVRPEGRSWARSVVRRLYLRWLFTQVDAYAARNGLKGLPRAELPSAWVTIKDGWYYVLVVVLLIVMLLHFKRESHAPFYATALLLVLNQLFSKDQRWRAKSVKADGELALRCCGGGRRHHRIAAG